ncbi:hypothetical protein K777_09955, partial [Campylobacter coli CVM 41970]
MQDRSKINILELGFGTGANLWFCAKEGFSVSGIESVSYTHLRAHETPEHLVCRLLLEKKKIT